MKGKRLWYTLRLCLIPGAFNRMNYLKSHNVFASVGEHCSMTDRKVPLYARLIRLGNNVQIASHVTFITHDITHFVLNNTLCSSGDGPVKEKIGCIEIGDNVFIGANSTILLNVRIGKNVIIGAGSLVLRDIPDNSVVAGVPARVIGSFEKYREKRLHDPSRPSEMESANEEISSELADWCWKEFEKSRDGNYANIKQ